jgi:DNA-binding LacI/PurR family transcriptional regulator
MMNLEDIAKKANVSRSTVSRVVNQDPNVNAKTRARVLEIIAEEGYIPNSAARTLVTKRYQIIGVAVPQTINVFFGDNSYFPMLLQGIASVLNQHDYAMLLWLAEHHEVRDSFASRVSRHRQHDGLIITSVVDNDPLFHSLVKHKRRFVMVESPPMYQDELSYVTIDNVAAARQATEHLIALGRRRIAHITGQLNIRDGYERLIGYRQALEMAGLPIHEELIVEGRFNYAYGYEAMKRLMPQRPDAIFCGGDTIAAGAMQAIREAGLRIPDDIAMVGFDDLDVATQVTPTLTTIRHHIQTVGSTAAQLLIDQIEGRLEHPYRAVLPTELVIRESTVRQP